MTEEDEKEHKLASLGYQVGFILKVLFPPVVPP